MCFSFSNSGSVVQWTLKFTYVCFPRGSWELLLGTCIQVDASTSKIHTERPRDYSNFFRLHYF